LEECVVDFFMVCQLRSLPYALTEPRLTLRCHSSSPIVISGIYHDILARNEFVAIFSGFRGFVGLL